MICSFELTTVRSYSPQLAQESRSKVHYTQNCTVPDIFRCTISKHTCQAAGSRYGSSLEIILLGSRWLYLYALCERTRTRVNIVVCFKQNECRSTKLVSGKISQAIGWGVSIPLLCSRMLHPRRIRITSQECIVEPSSSCDLLTSLSSLPYSR